MLATLYQTLKEYDKAIDIYSDLLREHPDHWKCLRGRGDALLSVENAPRPSPTSTRP